jgi:hypothetical protein
MCKVFGPISGVCHRYPLVSAGVLAGRRLHYSRVAPPLKAIEPLGTGKMKMVSAALERSIVAWMGNLPEFGEVRDWWAAKKVALRQQISRR